MKKLADIALSPTPWDSRRNFSGYMPGDAWLGFLSLTRDADVLDRYNWAVAFEALGGEGDNVQVYRFGHWAVGHIDYLAVREGSPEAALAEKILERLDNYPILDEDRYSEMELEEANEVWTHCFNDRERLNYILEHRDTFEFSSMSDLMAVVRGRYFTGYPSELLY